MSRQCSVPLTSREANMGLSTTDTVSPLSSSSHDPSDAEEEPASTHFFSRRAPHEDSAPIGCVVNAYFSFVSWLRNSRAYLNIPSCRVQRPRSVPNLLGALQALLLKDARQRRYRVSHSGYCLNVPMRTDDLFAHGVEVADDSESDPRYSLLHGHRDECAPRVVHSINSVAVESMDAYRRLDAASIRKSLFALATPVYRSAHGESKSYSGSMALPAKADEQLFNESICISYITHTDMLACPLWLACHDTFRSTEARTVDTNHDTKSVLYLRRMLSRSSTPLGPLLLAVYDALFEALLACSRTLDLLCCFSLSLGLDTDVPTVSAIETILRTRYSDATIVDVTALAAGCLCSDVSLWCTAFPFELHAGCYSLFLHASKCSCGEDLLATENALRFVAASAWSGYTCDGMRSLCGEAPTLAVINILYSLIVALGRLRSIETAEAYAIGTSNSDYTQYFQYMCLAHGISCVMLSLAGSADTGALICAVELASMWYAIDLTTLLHAASTQAGLTDSSLAKHFLVPLSIYLPLLLPASEPCTMLHTPLQAAATLPNAGQSHSFQDYPFALSNIANTSLSLSQLLSIISSLYSSGQSAIGSQNYENCAPLLSDRQDAASETITPRDIGLDDDEGVQSDFVDEFTPQTPQTQRTRCKTARPSVPHDASSHGFYNMILQLTATNDSFDDVICSSYDPVKMKLVPIPSVTCSAIAASAASFVDTTAYSSIYASVRQMLATGKSTVGGILFTDMATLADLQGLYDNVALIRYVKVLLFNLAEYALHKCLIASEVPRNAILPIDRYVFAPCALTVPSRSSINLAKLEDDRSSAVNVAPVPDTTLAYYQINFSRVNSASSEVCTIQEPRLCTAEFAADLEALAYSVDSSGTTAHLKRRVHESMRSKLPYLSRIIEFLNKGSSSPKTPAIFMFTGAASEPPVMRGPAAFNISFILTVAFFLSIFHAQRYARRIRIILLDGCIAARLILVRSAK